MHVVDGAGDPVEHLARAQRRSLDRRHLGLDLFGGTARLLGELFHLGGDHGETAARVARTSCLDGGVQGQEPALSGHLTDQRRHLADPRR